MTQKATNSLQLYKGGNPTTIAQLLKMQSSSVVNELKEHFGVSSIYALAMALSKA